MCSSDEFGTRCLGRLQQRRFEHRRREGFEVAATDVGIGVFGGDHFTLFGEADLATHRARRLGENGLIAGATTTANRATTTMEHAQAQAMFGTELVEHFHQRQFGLVQLPVAGENAAILVAVRIAEHDVLLAATELHQASHTRDGVIAAHDLSRRTQVADGFEQRHHDHRQTSLFAAERAAHQAGFLL